MPYGAVNKIVFVLKPTSSCDVYGVSTALFKKIVDDNVIAIPLSLFVSSSFMEGIFPKALYMSNVVLVPKKGCHDEISSYRSISLIPVMTKVYETIVKNQVSLFLTKKDVQ